MMKVILLLCLVQLIAATAVAPIQKVSGDDCGMCEFLVGQVESFLSDNSTETEILTKLENACTLIPNPTWASDCKGLISTYGPQLILAVVTKETPTQVCSMIGFCNSTQLLEPVNENGAIECLACTFLVKQAESYIAANKSESDIIGFLTNDCKILKDQTWVSACQGLVTAYAPQMIQMLLNKADPNTVCSTLHICNSTIALEIMNSQNFGGPECMLCEWLIGQVENYLEANATESVIISKLSSSCSLLKDGTFVAMCQALVSEYGPELINLLVNEVPPSTVCSTVKMCTSVQKHVKPLQYGHLGKPHVLKPKIPISL